MAEIGVRVTVTRLFCVHGSGESAEPYLWVVGFRLDGATLRQRANRLAWTSELFHSQGSHGVLGAVADPGTKIVVPPEVGTWDTSVVPLELTDGDGPATIPGLFGFAAALIEENNVPDHAAEAGHRAFNRCVHDVIDGVVANLDLAEVRAAASRRATPGRASDLALLDELKERLGAIARGIAAAAPGVVSEAIRQEMGVAPAMWAAIDKDEVVGVVAHVASSAELLAEPDLTVDFNDHIYDVPDGRRPGRFAYHLRSRLAARMRRRQVDPVLPTARYVEVQGVEQRMSRALGFPYAYQIGGVSDGRPWWLSRSSAAALITRGERDFYVRTPERLRVPVLVVTTPNSYWSYLTTSPSDRVENDLLRLPRLDRVPSFFRSVLESDV